MALTAPARLQFHGQREFGQDVRTQNVTAVAAIANIVKTSLGPVGLDKVGLSGKKEILDIDCRCSWTISAT